MSNKNIMIQILSKFREKKLRVGLKKQINASCLGCDAYLNGPYCPQCGQRDLDGNITLYSLFSEWVDERFGIDGKTWKTLYLLFLKPGRLTDLYIAGKRAQYIRPVRLLFVLIVLFVLLCNNFNITFFTLDVNLSNLNIDKTAILDSGDHALFNPILGVQKLNNCTNTPKQITASVEVINKLFEKSEVSGIFVSIGDAVHRNLTFLATDKCYLSDQLFSSLLNITWATIPFFAILLRLLFLRKQKTYLQNLIHTCHLFSTLYVLASILVVGFLFAGYLTFQAELIALSMFWIYSIFSAKYVYQEGWLKTMFKITFAYFFQIGIEIIVLILLWGTWFVGGWDVFKAAIF